VYIHLGFRGRVTCTALTPAIIRISSPLGPPERVKSLQQKQQPATVRESLLAQTSPPHPRRTRFYPICRTHKYTTSLCPVRPFHPIFGTIQTRSRTPNIGMTGSPYLSPESQSIIYPVCVCACVCVCLSVYRYIVVSQIRSTGAV